MKRKKIIFALVLTGFLLFSACGSLRRDNSVGTDTRESENVSEAGASTGSDTPEGTDNMDVAPGIAPKVWVETVHLQRYTEDGEVLLAEIIQDNMTLEGAGYEKAAEAVQRLFCSEMSDVERELDSYAEMAQEHYEATKSEDGWFAEYFWRTSYEITRLDTRVLSVKGFSYDYTGGAHGMGGEWGVTVDLESGLELALTRLAQDPAAFMEKTTDIVLKELADSEDELFADYESYVKENLESTDWYLDAAGIEFVFQPYAIGTYVAGNITVCVPYKEVSAYLKEEYLKPQGESVMRFPLDSEVRDVDGTHSLVIETRPTGEYSDETVLGMDGKETILGENVRVIHAFLIHRANNKTFLVFDMDWASDDYETFVYELGKEGAVKTASVGAGLDVRNVSPEEMNLFFSLYVLGTYSSEMRYELNENGEFTPLEDIYPIAANREWSGLVTVRELPVTVGGQEKMLPTGSTLCITGTDDDGIAWFEGTDGASGQAVEGEIHYERREDDYQLYIGGVGEYEYFESLPYVG